MKILKLVLISLLFAITSCSSVVVNADYDKNVDYSKYKSFAFYKDGIDKVELSDLDKKRILKFIDMELTKKGLVKSETPDLLINFFTKETENVNVNQFNMGWGFGWGWGPMMWGGNLGFSNYTQGVLFIDIIDAQNKALIWQGEGKGSLTKDTDKKDEIFNEFVTKILIQFPPEKK